jgi:hypothetical protein
MITRALSTSALGDPDRVSEPLCGAGTPHPPRGAPTARGKGRLSINTAVLGIDVVENTVLPVLMRLRLVLRRRLQHKTILSLAAKLSPVHCAWRPWARIISGDFLAGQRHTGAFAVA